ncbi:MAG: GNAT family N-acetyltransferase [Desulfovibrionaceae bacterium]
MDTRTAKKTWTMRTGYVPGLIGRVGELHGRYYASIWNSGAPFEILVLRHLCDFMDRYDPAVDLVLSAHDGNVLAGSIAIVGRPDPKEGDGAQLRFFIVDPAFHGRGMGKGLLHAALDWCRERGVAKLFLWTVDNLPESRGLYESVGFRVVERVPDDRYTVIRDNLRLELVL